MFVYRTTEGLQGDRMVSMERMQQVMRYWRDATTSRGPETRASRRSLLSASGRNQMVRIGTVMQQGVLQLVKGDRKRRLSDHHPRMD